MAYSKITSADLSGKGNTGKADTPALTKEQMQAVLDELSLDVIVPHFNDLIDEITIRDSNIYTKSETNAQIDQKVVEIGAGDMAKAVYDTNGDGVVDSAQQALKLQTARTINGVAFDGTANITVADDTKLPIAGGTFTGAVQADAGIRAGDYLRNINVKTSDASADVPTMCIYFTRK